MDKVKTRHKIRKAVVLSDKMQKTVVVSVERRYPHPIYRKVVRERRKYKVDDPKGLAHTGDIVEIIETRPISKEKHWRVVKIIKKGLSKASPV